MYKGALIALLFASTAQAGGLEITVSGQANGTIAIDLFEDIAPLHAAQISALAADGAYDGVVFHRVIEGFMAQTGDVQFGDSTDPAFDMRRAGTGGSELPDIQLEATSERSFTRGMVGMARSSAPHSANSQFFIMFADGAFLNGQYTIVGEVTDGMDVVDAIKLGEGQKWRRHRRGRHHDKRDSERVTIAITMT